jgi:hypothetical protein
LFKVAEAERAWVWLACGNRLPDAQAEAIGKYGFILSKKGHPLPSGRTGIYGHSCEVPLPFKRRFHPRPTQQPQPQQPGNNTVAQPPQPQPQPAPVVEADNTKQQLEADALAFLNAA